MIRRYALSVLFCLAAGSAFAAGPITPVVGGVQPIPPGATPVLTPIGLDHAPACLLIYQNEIAAPTRYYPTSAIVADDLHTTATGPIEICAYDIGYYSPTGPTDITVTFYDDDAGDNFAGPVVAGPFLTPGAPGGLNFVHIEVPGGTINPDVWMGVQFSNASAGLILSDPPTVGSSHNYWLQIPPGALFGFSDGQIGNFWLGLYASPAVQNVSSTWGQMKAIYP